MRQWRRKAACWQSKVDFHAKDPNPAKNLCLQCPVIEECRQWALRIEKREGHTMAGVWGGKTAVERAATLRADANLCRRGIHRMEGQNLALWSGKRRCKACSENGRKTA